MGMQSTDAVPLITQRGVTIQFIACDANASPALCAKYVLEFSAIMAPTVRKKIK
jgi:hypothetical protein